MVRMRGWDRLMARLGEILGPEKPRPLVQPRHVPWPYDRPKQYNASNEPCDMWTGPCSCGAWHSEGR